MTGEPVELIWVKGSGGDLGTLTESGLAVLRMDRLPQARRRLSRASIARTRWSPRSTTRSTARAGQHHPSTPRCTGSSMRRTSTICIRMPASRSPPRRTARSSPRRSTATRSSGCPGAGPASSSGSTSPPSSGTTRRRSAASSAGTASPRGATRAPSRKRTACGSSAPRRSTSQRARQEGAVRQAAQGVCRIAARDETGQGGGARTHDPRTRLARQPDGRPVHRLSGRARLPRECECAKAGRARHELPGPLPADQDQADAARPARGCPARQGDRAAQGAARAVPR